jgi:hypothetical protein
VSVYFLLLRRTLISHSLAVSSSTCFKLVWTEAGCDQTLSALDTKPGIKTHVVLFDLHSNPPIPFSKGPAISRHLSNNLSRFECPGLISISDVIELIGSQWG